MAGSPIPSTRWKHWLRKRPLLPLPPLQYTCGTDPQQALSFLLLHNGRATTRPQPPPHIISSMQLVPEIPSGENPRSPPHEEAQHPLSRPTTVWRPQFPSSRLNTQATHVGIPIQDTCHRSLIIPRRAQRCTQAHILPLDGTRAQWLKRCWSPRTPTSVSKMR
jgi:hypothetical protein